MRAKRSLSIIAVCAAVAACTGDPVRPPVSTAEVEPQLHTEGLRSAGAVTDLRTTAVTRHTAILAWTQVDDGTGAPAHHRLKYAPSPMFDWAEADVGCDAPSTEGTVGAGVSCTVEGLEPRTDYDFQLLSYRVRDGAWVGGQYSNVASAVTAALDAPGAIDDLIIVDTADASLTARWTQVNDGAGSPARYQVRYGAPPIAFEDASIGCDVTLAATEVGAPTSCTIQGLESASTYDVRVASYRLEADTVADVRLSNVVSATTAERPRVRDLHPTRTTGTTVTVEWTEVGDGTGDPAWYRVKYAESPMVEWKHATVGCEPTLEGVQVGAPFSCTIEGLVPGRPYDVQLMSYRMEDGVWAGAEYSNLVTARVGASSRGIWVDTAAIAAAPHSGPVWDRLEATAEVPCGQVDLSDPERYTHLCVMTKALLFAATGDDRRADEVTAYLADFSDDTYTGSAWVLGREIPAYVVAADLIGLPARAPALDEAFRAQLVRLRETPTDSGPANLVRCHEERPNNWGTNCGAARVAIAAYLEDEAELDRAASVFRGWLGDRAAYAGFVFGGPEGDLTWQCDPAAPVAVNPDGCAIDGHLVGGVLPDDQRRSGSFVWPPPRENYVWEALQGAVGQAVFLHNAGYTPFDWGNGALRRAVEWLEQEAAYPAEGDDEWIAHVLNHYYGTDFVARSPANPGKIMAWSDWTHG